MYNDPKLERKVERQAKEIKSLRKRLKELEDPIHADPLDLSEHLPEFMKDNLDRVREIERLTGEEYEAAKKQFLLDFRDYSFEKMTTGLIDEVVADIYPEEPER